MNAPHPKHVLEQYGVVAKKSLGQNFLCDEHILQRIVAAADVNSTDHVLEVGPGIGALTRLLAASADSVTAVELDNRMLPILETEFGRMPISRSLAIRGRLGMIAGCATWRSCSACHTT